MNEYQQRNAVLAKMGFPSYKDYLESDLWATIRARALNRDRYKCASCRKLAEEVHHRNYAKAVLEGKDISQLMSLCAVCHETAEVDDDGNKVSLQVANNRIDAFVRAGFSYRLHLKKDKPNQRMSRQGVCKTCGQMARVGSDFCRPHDPCHKKSKKIKPSQKRRKDRIYKASSRHEEIRMSVMAQLSLYRQTLPPLKFNPSTKKEKVKKKSPKKKSVRTCSVCLAILDGNRCLTCAPSFAKRFGDDEEAIALPRSVAVPVATSVKGHSCESWRQFLRSRRNKHDSQRSEAGVPVLSEDKRGSGTVENANGQEGATDRPIPDEKFSSKNLGAGKLARLWTRARETTNLPMAMGKDNG